MPYTTAGPVAVLLLVLQAFHVVFLCVHDLVPLGRWNDLRALRREDSVQRLLVVTLVQASPFAILFVLYARNLAESRPGGFSIALWVAYGALAAGELRAWWIPYFVRADPVRADRYRKLFGATHSFLPERNGIRPNTLHVVLHVATAATLVALALRAAGFA